MEIHINVIILMIKNPVFLNVMHWGLKGGILDIADYDPLGYAVIVQ